MDQLTFLPAEPPAKTSPSRDSARAWMETVATYPSSFAALLVEHAPSWIVWENVPGVFSLVDRTVKDGDFGTLLGGLGEIGYGVGLPNP